MVVSEDGAVFKFPYPDDPYNPDTEWFDALAVIINDDPVFVGVTYEPEKSEYTLYDTVRVTPHFTDPNNDSLSIWIRGYTAYTIVMDNIGANTIDMVAQDGRGGYAEVIDTLWA